MDEPIESENEQPPKRLAELVSEEVARQRLQQEEEAAYAVIENEPKHDPSNPGGAFGKRIAARIAAGQ